MYVYANVPTCIHMHICIHTHMCMYICRCIYIYVYIYISELPRLESNQALKGTRYLFCSLCFTIFIREKAPAAAIRIKSIN